MNFIATIILVLSISYLTVSLAKKVRIPSVVALIASGLVIGLPSIRSAILDPHLDQINYLGDLALLCLMFLAGLEISWKKMYKEAEDSLLIALFAEVVPFVLGFVVFYFMGFSVLISLIVAICLSMTAEATTARILLEMKKLKTKVGSALLGAGIIDDLSGLTTFIIVSFILNVSYLKQDLLIISAVAVFFIGAIVQNKAREHRITKSLESVLLICLIPFFFISLGIHFDSHSLFINPYLLMIILALAVAGKMIGVFLAKPFTDFSWNQLHLIGWGMNSRGAIELVIALIAFRNNMIPAEIYSSILVMTLVTTLLFPFAIVIMIKKYPKIMN